MKLNLTVLSAGKMEGKEIDTPFAQFLIGRDPKCNLRPSTPIISKRHCKISVRDERVFVVDLGSTNGTLVNDELIESEREIFDQDHLTVGPLEFCLHIHREVPVQQSVEVPGPHFHAHTHEDEAVADMLLSMHDTDAAGTPESGVQNGEPSSASTVFDLLSPTTETAENKAAAGNGAKRHDAAKAAQADTSVAAKAILDKYLRRPRV